MERRGHEVAAGRVEDQKTSQPNLPEPPPISPGGHLLLSWLQVIYGHWVQRFPIKGQGARFLSDGLITVKTARATTAVLFCSQVPEITQTHLVQRLAQSLSVTRGTTAALVSSFTVLQLSATFFKAIHRMSPQETWDEQRRELTFPV